VILWLRVLLSTWLVAPATSVVADVQPSTAHEDGDQTPPRPRSRGPPPAKQSGQRTARPAGNGTCSIHSDPVLSAHHPG
jgi:hypothetical protein